MRCPEAQTVFYAVLSVFSFEVWRASLKVFLVAPLLSPPLLPVHLSPLRPPPPPPSRPCCPFASLPVFPAPPFLLPPVTVHSSSCCSQLGFCRRFRFSHRPSSIHELELIQSHMPQKPVLWGEVGCACVAREVSVERGGMGKRGCARRSGGWVWV